MEAAGDLRLPEQQVGRVHPAGRWHHGRQHRRSCGGVLHGGATVNGNDPVELYDAAGQAIERARGGGGPTLLEAVTYRFCGHYFGDQSEYIPAEELADANAADPIPLFRQRLIDEFGVAAEELDEIDRAAQEEVNDAAEWAYEQPLPDPSELTTDVYAEETVR